MAIRQDLDLSKYTRAMSLSPRGSVHAANRSLIALCGAGMNYRSNDPVDRTGEEITCKRCRRALDLD